MPADNPQGIHRIERVLAIMAVTVVGLSLLALATVFILAGVGASRGLGAEGWYQFVAVLPLVGFPIAFLLIIAVVVLNLIRRRREAGDVR